VRNGPAWSVTPDGVEDEPVADLGGQQRRAWSGEIPGSAAKPLLPSTVNPSARSAKTAPWPMYYCAE